MTATTIYTKEFTKDFIDICREWSLNKTSTAQVLLYRSLEPATHQVQFDLGAETEALYTERCLTLMYTLTQPQSSAEFLKDLMTHFFELVNPRPIAMPDEHMYNWVGNAFMCKTDFELQTRLLTWADHHFQKTSHIECPTDLMLKVFFPERYDIHQKRALLKLSVEKYHAEKLREPA